MIRPLILRGLQRDGQVPGARMLVYLAQAIRYRARHKDRLRWSRLLAD